MHKYILSGILAITLSNSSKAQANETKKWLISFSSSDIGTVNTLMTFEFEDSTFTAYTRKNADRDILGFGTSSLGRIFTKSFENGSLLRIENGIFKIQNDTVLMAGIFRSALGSYYFNGSFSEKHFEAKLKNNSKEVRGTLRGLAIIPETPLENYPEIFNQVTEITFHKIYNPSILQSKQWKKFTKKMEQVSTHVQDDLEMVFAFFYYARKLPFSHYALLKLEDNEDAAQNTYEPQVLFEEKSSGTAYLNILSFGGTRTEMDSIMNIVKSKGYKNLIVDLRENPGGSVEAGLAFTKNIIDTTFYGGLFLTQKWFNKHSSIPDISAYSQFPHFTEANFDLIIEGINEEKGLCLKIVPYESIYTGKVYILTSNVTASTCEPIVYGLKQLNRATIIGEQTAGSMLNGEFFKTEFNFNLVVPTATYFTSDGFKIDGIGVSPDIEIPSHDALNYVIKELIKN